jgi:hypothetical protein
MMASSQHAHASAAANFKLHILAIAGGNKEDRTEEY